MFRLSLVMILASAPGLVSGADDLSRRARGDLALQARAILNKYCGECHGLAPAPSTLSLLDYGQLVTSTPPVPWVNLTDEKRSQLVEFIEDGSMPPGGRPRPTADEIESLKKWVKNKAPSYPKAFDERTTLQTMLDDLDRQPAEDVPFLRYVSLAHLVRDNEPLPNLGAQEFALSRALTAGSGRTVTPTPVDDTATLFRLDLRTLDWNAPDLFERIESGRSTQDVYPIVPYDLLLLEYPPSFVPATPADFQERLRKYLAATKLLRPVPFLRADWLAAALAPGKPLAADLKSLVMLAEALKEQKTQPCGPVPRPFANAKPAEGEAAPAVPLASWYGGDVAPNPDPFALKAEIVRPLAGNRPTTDVDVSEPYRIRVRGKRELRFLLLGVLADGTVRIQPVGGGNIVKVDEARLLGPETGPFESSSLITGRDSETEFYIVIAAEGVIPAPTIVRSLHPDLLECRRKNMQPVWRFLFDKPDFDPAKAARVVLPLTVHQKAQ